MKIFISPCSIFLVLLSIGLLSISIISSFGPIQPESFCYEGDSANESTITSATGLMEVDEKQKGAHVFGLLDTSNIHPFIQHNFEWVTLVTWSIQDVHDSPIMAHHNGDSLQLLRSDSNWVERIGAVRAAGFKVFLKPHVWVDDPADGKWRSDIFPAKPENWKLWKESYRNFILRFARIAEQAQAEMFCVGAELSRLSLEKPLFWIALIRDVRAVYSGKITYAANWYLEYEKISFWNELDYIGIQAYFPLVDTLYPSVQQISGGWDKYLPALAAIHKKYDRKILFTEMGYKSTADSGIKPWEWAENTPTEITRRSNQTQANCYEAFFNTVWKKEWFAGVHIWQLRSDFVENEDKIDLDFTPQGKPAAEVIAKGFE